MRLISSIFSSITLFSLLAQGTDDTHDTRPVCIVGAGPAGLSAAQRLENKGKQVIIFEKQAEVGGKSQEVYADGTYFPLGALLYTKATYTETLKIINLTGVPSAAINATPRWEYNITSGTVVASPPPSKQFVALLLQEVERYLGYWYTVFAPVSGTGYKKRVPIEMTVPASEWLANNDYLALPVVFVRATAAFGYGDIREVPILYLLQYLSPDIIAFFLGSQEAYIIDFHKVFVLFAEKAIKGPIHLDSEITKIDRSGRFPTISYKSNPKFRKRNPKNDDDTTKIPRTQKQECTSLILAFGPTLTALQAANLELSTKEKAAFAPITTIQYWASAVRLAIPYGTSFHRLSTSPTLPPPADGNPVSFVRFHPESNVASVFSWAASSKDKGRDNVSTKTAYNLLKQTLSKFNKDPADLTAVSTPVGDRDILGVQKTEYFPHFDSKELRDGWNAKVAALQGKQNTYFASSLAGFELVEHAVRAGIDVVESYF